MNEGFTLLHVINGCKRCGTEEVPASRCPVLAAEIKAIIDLVKNHVLAHGGDVQKALGQ